MISHPCYLQLNGNTDEAIQGPVAVGADGK